ncbi:xylosyltransferase 2-like isoform X2 [Ornithodoros turicata]|uniref:xylosyltransferase 2-like isoform X2 n=1 Tax=Ornithodoros turicata TaxID=34597 RepID=UPI00313949CF
MERVTLLVGSRRRRQWCRRYSPFLIVGIAILVVQILLGYCFYITATSDDEGYAWINNVHQLGAGRHQSAQSDDEYEEEESAAGLLPPDTFLGFHPPCDITEKDAVSAIRRASTMDCKIQLANVSCLVKEWLLYPHRLPRYCPLRGEASVRRVETKLEQPGTAPSGIQVRIAFVLSVSGRALRQVLRLLRTIYSPSHFFYIHVDVRQDYLFRELLWLEERFSNIRLARKRFPTMWGGSSLLHMLLDAMKELLHTSTQWHYLINLSETDYPIKPLKDLEQFLAANMGTNFVKSHGQDTQRFIAKQALDRTFHQCDGRMWRLGPRGLPWGIRLDGGSDWLALHRDFVSYVALGDDPLLRGLKALFAHTLLPAESFFHTTLQNSAFCGTIVDNNLHLVNWKRKQGCKCQYRHVVDWCGCSPNVFRSPDDWIRLRATTDRSLFFARKFEPVLSQHMVDQVEQYLLNVPRTASELLGAQSYWQSTYNVQDTSPPADQARLSAYGALCRLAFKWIQKQHSCSAHFLMVTQATLYFDSDVFKGLLVSYKAKTVRSQQPVEVEAWVKSTDVVEHFQEGRLISLKVGSEFDPKEQLLRNFGGLLGPHSDIVAVHEWGPGSKGDHLEVTFIWQDPMGVSTASTPIQVDASAQVLQHRPTIHQPLAEGVWTLSLLSNGKKLAQTRFAVIGPSRPRGNSTQSNLITADDDAPQLEVVSKFWTVVDACFVSVPSHPTGGAFCDRLDSCQTTSWSSYFPDPKSRVRGFGPR